MVGRATGPGLLDRALTMMMRRTIRLQAWGGLGDAVLATTAVAALKAANPTARLVLYATRACHRDVFLHNPHIERIVDVRRRRSAVARLMLKLDRRNTLSLAYGQLKVSLVYDKPVTAIICDLVGVEPSGHAMALYLTDDEMRSARQRVAGTRMVVAVQITSRVSANQNWPVDRWAVLVARCPDVQFVQLGLADEPPIPGAIDWRGRTTVREACAIVKAASAFVGVVSGLGHVAAAVGTPAVILFGASTPAIWGHASAVNLYRALHCSPCIDLLGGVACPYGAPCMSGISVDEVEKALRAQLHRRAA